MLYLLIFFSSMVLTLFATPYVIRKFIQLNIVDKPDSARKIHTTPIPTMGGIIIYMVVVVTFFSYSADLPAVRIIILSSSLIVICGIFDDMLGLNWKVKFILQAIASGGLIFFLAPSLLSVHFFGFTFTGIASYILLLLFILGLVNSINLLDGMDGLVSGYSLLVFITIFVISIMAGNQLVMILSASMSGAIFGFLKYNAHPAKIFLGDTGSLTLGFFLIVSTLMLTLNVGRGSLDLTFAVILFGVPIVDTLKVMLIRILNRQNPFLPDKNHIHHVIFGSDVKQKTTVFIIQIFTVLYLITAVYYLKTSQSAALIAFAILSISQIFVKRGIRVAQNSFIHKLYVKERDIVPQKLVKLFSKYFIPFSMLLIGLLFVFLFPGKSEVGRQILMLLIAASILLMIVSTYHLARSKTFNDIYVLINAAIFFSVTNLSYPLISTLNLDKQFISLIIGISVILLLGLIVFFLVTREKLFGNKVSFLTGTDLIFLVLISLLAVVQNYITPDKLHYFGANLILGFIVYLWYKAITQFKQKYGRLLYYVSFVIPLATLIYIYLR